MRLYHDDDCAGRLLLQLLRNAGHDVRIAAILAVYLGTSSRCALPGATALCAPSAANFRVSAPAAGSCFSWEGHVKPCEHQENHGRDPKIATCQENESEGT